MGTEENRKLVGDAFSAWEQGDAKVVFGLLADDLRWTVIGSSPISGSFDSKADFVAGAVRGIGSALAGPIECHVERVIADGDIVAVQWRGDAPTKSGKPYHQTYCWVMRVADGRVVEGTAYLDTGLLTDILP